MQQVQLEKEKLLLALEYNTEFFIHFFLGQELTFPVPPFHKTVLAKMIAPEIKRFCCAIPRDHAKTTLAKLACVHHFLFSKYRFIVYLSNTLSIAIPAANDVISFLTSENCERVFGKIEFLSRQEGKGIYKFRLGNKLCFLRAMGAGQQVRGINVDNTRPQLAVVDDLEDNDNIATEPLFLNLKRWVYGPFRKALDKFDNKIIWLGNMIAQQSMLYENCQSDFWYSMLYGCLLEDGTPLWPDAWSIEKLVQDFKEYQEAGVADIWFAEMMNMPMALGNGIILAEEINYKPAPLPRSYKYAFITVDLAISKKERAHKTVVAVHVLVDPADSVASSLEDPWWQVACIEGFHGIDPIALFDVLIGMAKTWGVQLIGIENVAYQDSLQYIYPHMCMKEGVDNIEFVPLSAKERKTNRIAPWAGLIKKKEYAINDGDFQITQELLAYDPSKAENKDDYIDACSHGPQMLARYSHLVWREITGDAANDSGTRSITEISGV